METLDIESLNKFWVGKRVLVTGHTGFKGSWLSLWLSNLGADLIGVSLDPISNPSLWNEISNNVKISDCRNDIRGSLWKDKVREFKPEIVFHMAAQPLVVTGWEDPLLTFDTNVLGTANLLQELQMLSSVKVCLIVTSDKVYKLDETKTPRKETSELGGGDPYSASKSCVEIMVSSWPSPQELSIGTARSGNVIGGGDWSRDRLIPDIVNSIHKGTSFVPRSPNSIRPWQHVVEPLAGYLAMAKLMYLNPESPKVLNFGPSLESQVSVREILEYVSSGVDNFQLGKSLSLLQYKESQYLLLDSSLAAQHLDWIPKLDWKTSVNMTLEWYRNYYSGAEPSQLMQKDIDQYLNTVL
jgi:CDP-glucose 4,6-dehydratase